MTDATWHRLFYWLLPLGIVSIFGLAILVPSVFTGEFPPAWLAIIGLVLMFPGMIFLSLVTMWHWKERYRGEHSALWGGLILLEATGWFKLVYLFRHIIPDARGRGRYAVPRAVADAKSMV